MMKMTYEKDDDGNAKVQSKEENLRLVQRTVIKLTCSAAPTTRVPGKTFGETSAREFQSRILST